MHFVTGGAFNGKRARVKETYPDAVWLSAYRGDSFAKINPADFRNFTIIFEGLEAWVKELIAEKDPDDIRALFRDFFSRWQAWEKADNRRKVVVIGTDIHKGIVPVEGELRAWRDITGWVYQDLVKKCEQVDLIWYGICQTIKGE